MLSVSCEPVQGEQRSSDLTKRWALALDLDVLNLKHGQSGEGVARTMIYHLPADYSCG